MLEFLKMQMIALTGLRHDSRAVTAMEYGLIAALIAVVCITALTTIGSNLSAKLTTISNSLH